MKKMVKAAIAAVLVCFSSSLFAAEPASFLKTTTYGLFEDETVDNLAWGLKDEDVKGLVLGAFDDTATYNFSIGAGAFLGDLWWSVYDTGDFFADIKKTQTVTNDAVAADGVNTDYVDVTSDTYTTRNNANAINNELYISFANDDWGVQTYWKVNDTTDAGNFGKQVETDEEHDIAFNNNTTTRISRYRADNTLGAYFKGIGSYGIGDSDLYFQLNQFEIDWYASLYSNKVDFIAKQNGAAVYDGTTDKNYNQKQNINRFKPTVAGEMGFSLPDLGGMSTKFILGESFWCQFGLRDYKIVSTNVNETIGQKVTTVTTTKRDYKYSADRFQWKNILKPVFVFDFDVGERVSVKASAGATVTINNTPGNKYYTITTVTETTTYDKTEKTTTKNYKKNVTVNGSLTPTASQLTDSITTTAEINTALAVVYQVKPEKFNLNLGVKWNPTKLTWVSAKTTNQTFVTSQYEENTNAAGGKTVTKNQTDYFTLDGPVADDATTAGESKTTDFDVANAGDTELNIGATWFINKKVTLDMAYSAAFDTATGLTVFGLLTPGLLTSTFKIMFSVKF